MPKRQLTVAVEALCLMASAPEGGALPLPALAQRLKVSLSYLEALFASLRVARLVDSQRGPGGGYRLTREPASVSVAEVAVALGLATVTGLPEPRHDGPADTREHQATLRLLATLERGALAALSDTNLGALIARRAQAEAEAATLP